MRPVTVRVACVQLEARSLRDAERALDDVLAGIVAGAAQGARIVVLPECSYPAYVLLGRRPFRGIPSADDAIRSISHYARACGCDVAVGIACPDSHKRLRNTAVYVNRRGEQLARYEKLFLWNFDCRWFEAGDTLPVFDTEVGTLGMMICADGRMPEIARTLAYKGAWLVLEPTAWVGQGAAYSSMRNPQVDFMMRVRARENGIWIAAADKCGSENSAVHYVGRSMIVAPDGIVEIVAPADRPAVIIADVERRASRGFVAMLSPAERRSLVTTRPRLNPKAGPPLRLGIFQGPLRTKRNAALATLEAQGIAGIIETTASNSALRDTLRRIHGLRATIIDGRRMLAPEPSRAAALDGADVLVWTRPPNADITRDVARTRAIENRSFVIVCASSGHAMPACVVDPDGAILAEALTGVASGFVANIDAARSRSKVIVPGTDAFAARVPKAFRLFSGRRPA